MSPPGRPKGLYRSAQHEGSPVSGPATPRWMRAGAWALVAAALALVFAAYLNPHLAVDLANQLWACF